MIENFDLNTIMDQVLIFAPMFLWAIVVLFVGLRGATWVTKMLRKSLEKSGLEVDLVSFLTSAVGILLKVLVFFSAAGIVGIETASFVAILAAVGFAIGLALQGSLGNLAAGILILFFKPYRSGDYIVAQGYEGTVKEIQLFTTVLTSLDNRIIYVPNGAISSGPIENLTAPGERKVPMVFGIGYGDDIDKARQIIQKVADECPQINHDKPVDIYILELADSSVNFAVRPWCKTEHYWDVHFYMHENVKKAFDEEGVSIPFPQMDVHVDQPS